MKILESYNYAVLVVVIWGVLTHPPQIIQKIMLKIQLCLNLNVVH
eukprot:SAG11_NODE_26020_length_350_cov_11.820717_1_plen_44_part_01